jgi:hypothetical protein
VKSRAEAAGIDPKLIAAMKRDLALQEDGSIRLKREMDRELKAAQAAYEKRTLRNRCTLLAAALQRRCAA